MNDRKKKHSDEVRNRMNAVIFDMDGVLFDTERLC